MTLRLLQKVGVNVALLYGDEWCCGSPMIRIGHRGPARKLAERNVNAMKNAGAKTVVFSCAGCYRAFKVDCPELGLQPPFELGHAIDLAL